MRRPKRFPETRRVPANFHPSPDGPGQLPTRPPRVRWREVRVCDAGTAFRGGTSRHERLYTIIPRLCSDTVMRRGAKARRKVGTAAYGSTSPPVKTSRAA